MISMDELESTAKRMDLVINNSSDDGDVFIAMQIKQNLMDIHKQLANFIASQNYKAMLEKFKEQRAIAQAQQAQMAEQQATEPSPDNN